MGLRQFSLGNGLEWLDKVLIPRSPIYYRFTIATLQPQAGSCINLADAADGTADPAQGRLHFSHAPGRRGKTEFIIVTGRERQIPPLATQRPNLRRHRQGIEIQRRTHTTGLEDMA